MYTPQPYDIHDTSNPAHPFHRAPKPARNVFTAPLDAKDLPPVQLIVQPEPLPRETMAAILAERKERFERKSWLQKAIDLVLS